MNKSVNAGLEAIIRRLDEEVEDLDLNAIWDAFTHSNEKVTASDLASNLHHPKAMQLAKHVIKNFYALPGKEQVRLTSIKGGEDLEKAIAGWVKEFKG